MAESSEVEVVLDPVKASTLLDLERGRISQGLSAEATRTGIWIQGLDTRFRDVWQGGRVIGIGTAEATEDGLDQERVSAAYISFHQLRHSARRQADDTRCRACCLYISSQQCC